ncbi:MAG TPA: phosphotransferase [Thermomicrobiaceae bacterium]|nr:phosphotransferase [Thermomicrobiaceae bacterium]
MKTPLTQLQPALEDYDLAVLSAREIPSGFNQHFEIRTPEGPKHLIIFREQRGKPPAELQFQLRRHAIDAGFDLMPRPVTTASGRAFARTTLGTVAIVDWVPGKQASTEDSEARPSVGEAARVLAWLHRDLRDFRPPRVRPDLLSPLYLPADRWVDRAPELAAELRGRLSLPAATDERVQAELDAALGRWDADAYDQALEDGTCVVHGDYRPANLIMDHERIAAVVDVDAAFWESRVYDLAYAAFQFSGPECLYPQERPQPAREFVRGYVAAWPLSAAELRLLPFFLRQVVLKRLFAGRDVEARLALLDQLDDGLDAALVGLAA